MFIGEAPGYHEDQQGLPFVGPSGKLLDKLLAAIKLSRSDVFIANVIKCRPPENRDPLPDEIAACKTYLDRQIAAIDPRVIVTLGRFSMSRWWPGERISQVHGQPKTENGRILMAMFHPAAALRDQVRTMGMFKEDGLTIPSLLEKAEQIARTELWGQPQTEPEPLTAKPASASRVSEEKKTDFPAKPPLPGGPIPYETEPVTLEKKEVEKESSGHGSRKKKESTSGGEQLKLF